MQHSTVPFLQDVSSRMDKTGPLNKSHHDKNGIEKGTPEGTIHTQNDEKENDRSSITSPISINISQDDKSSEDGRIQTVSSNSNDFVSRTKAANILFLLSSIAIVIFRFWGNGTK